MQNSVVEQNSEFGIRNFNGNSSSCPESNECVVVEIVIQGNSYPEDNSSAFTTMA